jgi:4'-phosphopantetheinyl transferase
MLYIFDEVDKMDDGFPDSVVSLLSEERYAKAQKIKSPLNRKASVAAYLLLRIALREVYGINEAVEFEYTEKGKPLLKDYPHIHFSLSHSKSTVACAVSDIEAGVDVQHFTPVSDRVARRVLTEGEYQEFKESHNADEFFCRIWVVKESHLKRTGQGLATELRDLPADSVKDRKIINGKNYFCCVCGSTMEVKYIRRDDFEKLCN